MERYYDDMERWMESHHEYGCCPEDNLCSDFLYWLRYGVHLLKRLRCRIFGHRWIDDSTAGPDSGNMDMYCPRCGEHFHHQLY